MIELLPFLISGLTFGLAAGFTPGPTTTLVIAQTLRHGLGDGVKVAIAPAFTDGPIIALALVLLGRLAQFEPVLGGFTLLGSIFLIYLAWESLKVRGIELLNENIEARSLRKGIIVNILNPHPYLFWFVIGAPLLLKASDRSILAAVLFIVGLYVCLIGAKILIACLVARSRSFLKSRGYIYINRLLGVALFVFALVFLKDGLEYLGVISSAK